MQQLLDEVPVWDLREEMGLRPTVFYRWQKEFFESGAAADNLGLCISPRNLIFVHSLGLFPFPQQRCQSDTDQQSFG